MYRIIFILAIFSSSCSSSKIVDSTSDIDRAEYLVKRGQYEQAENIFLSLIDKNEKYQKAIRGIVEVYQITNRPTDLINLLKHEYDKTSNVFLLSALAATYRNQGEFHKSQELYESYKDQIGPDHRNVAKVDETIEELNFIVQLLDNPKDINLIKLDNGINSEYPEYSPNFSLNANSVVFTRKIRGQEDLFEATWDGSGYNVLPIEAINTKYNEGAQTISGKGDLLIFTHCNEDFGFGSCDLYQTSRIDGKWQKPSNLGKTINSAGWESHPSISPDGNVLYFASNRKGGFGKSDIWRSEKINGEWQPPTNLGPKINTIDHDDSPFIHADGRTIYFRSKGHLGIGGYDIFVSRYSENLWNTPINVGAPINTLGNEGNLVVSLDGRYGYYSSDMSNNDMDIYRFELPLEFRPEPMTYVEGIVLSHMDKKPIPAKIEVTDIEKNVDLVSINVDAGGKFLFAVPVKKMLSMHIEQEGYVFHSSHIAYDEVRSGQDPYEEIISLFPIKTIQEEKAIKPVILKNIFFASNSAVLLPQSKVEVDYLSQLLLDKKELKITIIGHTDNVGNDKDNLYLSLERAKAVRAAILLNGISPERIKYDGKGEMDPIASNETEEGRAINRRTEFIINGE